MKCVAASPHIRSRSGDGVFLLFRIVDRRAGLIDPADVVLAIKQAEGFRLGRYRGYKKIEYCEYDYEAGNSDFHRRWFPRQQFFKMGRTNVARQPSPSG